jgi:hypothetical protein
MNDLIFYALLIALLYYFFIYLPSQKKSNPDPDNKSFTHPKSNQTNPNPNKDELVGPKAEFPGPQYIECPGAITKKDEQELEKTLDYMIKGMNELSKDLDKY